MTQKRGPEHRLALVFGHLQQGDEAMDQGDLSAALGHFRKGLAALRKLAQAEPSNGWWQKQLAHSQMRIGTVLLRQGRTAPARVCLEDSRAICLRALDADPGTQRMRWWIPTHLENLGDAIFEAGKDPDRALEHYQSALAIWRRLAAEDPEAADGGDVATALVRVGSILEVRGDLAGALERFREALALRLAAAQAYPAMKGWQVAVAFTHARVGAVLEGQQDVEGALASHRSCVAILRGLVEAEPANTDWQEGLSYSLRSIGDILQSTGTLEEALEHHEQSAGIWSTLMAAGQRNSTLLGCLASTLEEIGDMRYGLEDLPGALRSCQESQRLWQQLVSSEPGTLEWRERLGTSHMNVSDLMEELQDLAGAFRSCQQAVATRQRLVDEAPTRVEWQHDLAVSQAKLEELTSRLMSPPTSEVRMTPRFLH
jgi:tetratricopeptide (TPR) repeat protein